MTPRTNPKGSDVTSYQDETLFSHLLGLSHMVLSYGQRLVGWEVNLSFSRLINHLIGLIGSSVTLLSVSQSVSCLCWSLISRCVSLLADEELSRHSDTTVRGSPDLRMSKCRKLLFCPHVLCAFKTRFSHFKRVSPVQRLTQTAPSLLLTFCFKVVKFVK